MRAIRATIVRLDGAGPEPRCSFGHAVGEAFAFTELGCDRPLCIYALQALLPAVNVLLNAGAFPWHTAGEPIYWGCPHPGSQYEGLGQLIFQLEALD